MPTHSPSERHSQVPVEDDEDYGDSAENGEGSGKEPDYLDKSSVVSEERGTTVAHTTAEPAVSISSETEAPKRDEELLMKTTRSGSSVVSASIMLFALCSSVATVLL